MGSLPGVTSQALGIYTQPGLVSGMGPVLPFDKTVTLPDLNRVAWWNKDSGSSSRPRRDSLGYPKEEARREKMEHSEQKSKCS